MCEPFYEIVQDQFAHVILARLLAPSTSPDVASRHRTVTLRAVDPDQVGEPLAPCFAISEWSISAQIISALAQRLLGRAQIAIEVLDGAERSLQEIDGDSKRTIATEEVHGTTA